VKRHFDQLYSANVILGIYDELYDNKQFEPSVPFGRGVNQINPMLSNIDLSNPQQCHVSGFVKLFNKSGGDVGRLAYFQPGERIENYGSGSKYGQIIRNANLWLAKP
jgi:hypothetical protein